MEAVGRVAFEAERLRPFLPTYLHLLASALFPIYVGSHASLSIPSSASRPKEKHSEFADEEPEIVAEKVEGLTPKDAILFPLLAGFTLSSLYFIIKWLEDPSILNKILSYYFMQVGFLFGTKFLKDSFTVIRSICLPNQYAQEGLVWQVNRSKRRYDAVGLGSENQQNYHVSPLPGLLRRLPLPKFIANQIWYIRALLYAKCYLNFHLHRLVTVKIPVGFLDALAITATSALVGFFTFFYKPWYLSNLLGFAFCYGSTQYMSPTTFWTGTLLLTALFCYDIYFVFFTPMMVTVATKLDIPIKLLFPRPPSPAETEKGRAGLAMLGLGDIVIPGMMIALALRFDLYIHYLRKSKKVDGTMEKATYVPVTGGWGERLWVRNSTASPLLQAKVFPKTYFKAGLIGYALGMITTLLAMQVTDHAQPALLYLVPGVLIALWGTAAYKGDINEMWNYTEDKEAENPKSSSKKRDAKSPKRTETENGKVKLSQLDRNAARVTDSDVGQGDEIENKGTLKDKELEHTSTTTDEESDGDAQTPSESLSDLASSKTSSPRSDHGELAKGRSDGASKDQEHKCRHLIWFSIDFPQPPSSPEQTEVEELETTTEPLKGSVDIAEAESKKEHDSKKPSDGEPAGKRRRVR